MAVLSEEQIMLRNMGVEWARDRASVTVLRQLYDGESVGQNPDIYAEMASMGWTGILIPESHGGSDFGALSLGLLLEQLGRTLLPSALWSSALVAATALKAGTETQQARWLPGIADGSVIAALATAHGGFPVPNAPSITASIESDGWRLSGRVGPVPDGMLAHLFILSAETEKGTALFLVPADSPGLSRRALAQIDARAPAILELDGVAIEAQGLLAGPENAAQILEHVLDCARVGLAAEMLGSATQAFETTLEYLKVRVQFDRLIGSFQALQHRAACMFQELELLRSAVESALAAIDAQDADLPAKASAAKALAGEILNAISNEMVQMHGGIGMTHEHDAGLYLKRARVADQLLGNAAYHRERWGRLRGF